MKYWEVYVSPLIVFLVSSSLFFFLRHLTFHILRKRLRGISLFETLHKAVKIPSVLWILSLSLYLAIYFSEHLQKQTIYAPLLEKLVEGLLIISFTFAVSELTVGLIRLYIKKSNISLPPTALIYALIRATVIALGVITLLNFLGVPVTHFITTLGIGALAVSLALQGTLSNFFSGLNIIASRQVEIGDFIKLDGEEGFVVDITWMNTVIKRRDNNIVVVPNSKLVSSVVINYRKPEPSMVLIVPIGVSYSSDLEKVESITVEVAREVQRTVEGADPEFEPFIRYSSFGDFSINLNIILRVADPDAQFLVKHEFIKRLKRRYDKESIEIPFPVRTVYLKTVSQHQKGS
ncbi:MAG: mechanosensitive ion channel family protein [Aquificaceae bacterium]